LRRLAWRDTLRLLSLLVAAFFIVAAILQAVLSFDLTGAPPADKPDFIDTIVAFFAWEEGRNPIDLAASALVAIGFLALGGVGALLARLADAVDARRTLISLAMVAGAILGTASQLWWMGVKPVATSPQYCDCGFRAEEITSRLMALRIAGSVQTWLLIGGIVAISVGVLLAVTLVRRAGISNGWVWLSYILVVASLISSVFAAAGIGPWDQYSTLLVAGILIPAWALWLAVAAPNLAAPDTLLGEVPAEPISAVGG
jgi:hypothetical protein